MEGKVLDTIIPDLLNKSHAKHIIIYDVITRFAPGVFKGIGAAFCTLLKRKASKMMDKVYTISGASESKIGSVLLERKFNTSGEMNDMFDGILALASDLPDTKYVKRTSTGLFIVDKEKYEIKIAPDVYFMQIHSEQKNGEIESMTIEVYSNVKNVVELRNFIDEMELVYRKKRGNKLGKQLFFFDEIPVNLPMCCVEDPVTQTRKMEPDLTKAPKKHTFQMFPLHTNKSMKTIYGGAVTTARKRINFFLENSEWYKERGIPYTLGILLHGAPGCGKTSFIKAVAKDTSRHVVNIKLNKNTTVQQINNFFYSPRLDIVQDGQSISYDIPIEKRIIVMEDIDCLTNIVTRNVSSSELPSNNSEQLNLSVLLNILDGVLETPGRIVIMTSNEPEKLDPALIRPGRIDINIEFCKCTRSDIIDIVEGFCGGNYKDWYKDLQDDVYTPAEVCKIVFENIEDPQNALSTLANYTTATLK